ncbi:hypothetical protein OG234_13375 [Streptomyces sp. NBC_01420]|uniref:LPD29 domain-containing protein n=1 Tax=Streptomyces sp. NBC_01420 TaxID=2903858 RepID=UPI0032497164
MTTIETRHISAELKRQLVAAFPGVKFSVRSDITSLSIRWTDGPDTEDVEEIARKMKGSTWDGWENCYKRTGNTVTVTIAGERVTGDSLIQHVSTDREISEEALAEATALWSTAHDGAEPAGMTAPFVCGEHLIRENWASTQVLQIAKLVVLPARWKAHQKATADKKSPKAADAPAETPGDGLTVSHSAETGITVTGTRMGDGSAPTLKAAGLRWYRKGKLWYVPGTRNPESAARLQEVRARLREAGMRLTADQPAPAVEAPTAELAAVEEPSDAPGPEQPAAARLTTEEAVMQNARDYLQDAPGFGAHTAAASAAVIDRKVKAGVLREERLTGTLPALTAGVTAKAVRDMRAQGLTHEQVRQRLNRKRAEAQHKRDLRSVTVLDAMIAAHAGIVADEEAKARAVAPAPDPAPELEPAAPKALPAAPAAKPARTVPVGRPGMDAGPHRVVNTGETLAAGMAFAFRCLDCEQRGRLVEFGKLACTDAAESAYFLNVAHRLLADVTFRDATRFDLTDELGHFGDETGPDRPVTLNREDAETRLSYLLRKGATHAWYSGELRLRVDGRSAASVKAAPDAPAPVASGITYRGVHVPASIAKGWEGEPGAAWRAGVDAACAHHATAGARL